MIVTLPELLALLWGRVAPAQHSAVSGQINEQQSQKPSTCWYSTNIGTIHQESVWSDKKPTSLTKAGEQSKQIEGSIYLKVLFFLLYVISSCCCELNLLSSVWTRIHAESLAKSTD